MCCLQRCGYIATRNCAMAVIGGKNLLAKISLLLSLNYASNNPCPFVFVWQIIEDGGRDLFGAIIMRGAVWF